VDFNNKLPPDSYRGSRKKQGSAIKKTLLRYTHKGKITIAQI
jgi:hypothetical protein